MPTLFFCFPNEAAFVAVMPPGFERRGETCHPLPAGVEAMRVLPHPLTVGGKWDMQGAQLEAPQVLDGYHVNLLADEPPEGWAAHQVQPSSPMAVFVGDHG